jgi:D-amino-acid dehydrogenase
VAAPRSVAVVGAGVVGVCCALYLQRAGSAVTVFDPKEPGDEASRSNAGILSAASVVPTAMPGIVRQVPRMLRDPLAPLAVRWRYLPRIAPWLVRFVRASRPARVEAISIALHGLIARAHESWAPLWASSGAEAVVRSGGNLYTYQTDAAFAGAQAGLELRRRRGIPFEVLDGGQVAELEPALAGAVKRAVFFPQTRFTTDPGRLVRLLAAEVAARGGRFVRERVTGFDVGPGGPRALRTPAGAHPVESVVVAAGAWSRPLAAALGSRVPLDTERGYVVVLPHSGVRLGRALISGDYHFALTPMDEGLRLAGTDELAGLTAPPNPARAEKLVASARRLFPHLGTEGSRWWMSFRPSLPDSLPVIGPSPRHASVFFAFGHGHLGLSLAAVTGRLVAELASGQAPAVDLAAYRVDRF